MRVSLTPNLQVLIIYNPTAGQSPNLKNTLDRVANLWRDLGWQVQIAATTAPGDATTKAQIAAQSGYNAVVAAGGDGTVNEVMNGLVGTETALGVLPLGTVNIWAREMGLSMDMLKAAESIAKSELTKIDVGMAGDRYFLLMAGIGFDAAVTATVRSDEKKILGAIAYVKQAVQIAWNFRGVRLKLRVDGKRIRGKILMVIIGNSQLYGGVVKFTAHATIDDGLLDVCVIKGRGMLSAPRRLISIFARHYNRDPRVQYYQAKEVEIRNKRGKHLPIQVDGDYLGATPMNFRVVPESLWIMVPPNADRSLWRSVEG
ncbi:diacylglycerol/lipid kinase family protein [Chamaesiphon polymorphus]|uniref:Diacylglycerol kinase n=1 Tax=Chamaesiphon polymorphus CCALA 037 TaxID=2107692 RepID=A0A2T1GG02_9CYAN|nr:diacylglycerol kinase family protein [Chamaesiphon polymorphus]PSB56560.1 diacylglycerol kinase [Chamaesiphon polymorphus CCALA 037]